MGIKSVSQFLSAIQSRDQFRPVRVKNPSEEGSEERRYLVAPGVKMATHETGFAFLHVETGQMHLCNGAAATMWRGIAAGDSTTEIAGNMSHEYGVSVECAHEDVWNFATDLIRRKLIIRARSQRWVASQTWWVLRALWELAGYDVQVSLFGFRAINDSLEKHRCMTTLASASAQGKIEQLTRAVKLAESFYWRSVRCLHGSSALVRLLRHAGIPAQLVIGYRLTPFFSHAWVEVNGRVVNDATAMPRGLTILHRV